MPLVSVIIPTRNRADLLGEAIESVLAVDRRDFEVEIIVVDNGSTDRTRDVARQYPVVFLSTKHLGASAARNTGMAAARGEFIAFLDDDDLWLPGNGEVQLALLQEHTEYAAAYAQALVTSSDGTPYGNPLPDGLLSSGWIFEDLLTHWPQIGTVVVRASIVREIGGFDTALSSEEEWDWLLRIASRHPIGRIAQPVILFRQCEYDDHSLTWCRLPNTVRVFRKHTRDLSWARRLSLERILWSHRGWYASVFLQGVYRHARQGESRQMVRCLYYAALASPVHTLRILLDGTSMHYHLYGKR